MFRTPWRWSRRPLANIKSIVEDIYYGIKNVIRWTPVIWYDADFDWCYLAEIMEYKLRRMEKVFETGHLVGCDKNARNCRIVADLLRRQLDDVYVSDWETDYFKSYAASRRHRQRDDMKYAGTILGKYMLHWWD